MKLIVYNPKKILIILFVIVLLGITISVIPLSDMIKPVSLKTTQASKHVILGANDQGMHCLQDDYSVFMILPPANTVRVQVFDRSTGKPVTEGIIVSYAYATHKKNPAETNNFWDYAKQYGFMNLTPGQGISGNYIAGNMLPDPENKCFKAEYIPVTNYNDQGNYETYPLITITAKDKASGAILSTAQIVTPLSTEMLCSTCHGREKTFQSILKAHDQKSGTKLYADYTVQKLHACAECHRDNILGRPGKNGVQSLSQAMHGFHASHVLRLPVAKKPEGGCYLCHPGPTAKCLRGVMAEENITCVDCHGTMTKVAKSQEMGRQAWLEEPSCSMNGCHAATFQPEEKALYKNSKLTNSPVKGMNGYIYCNSCHNSTHAEWPSTNKKDNILPEAVQDSSDPIKECQVCHSSAMQGKIHQ